MDQRLLPRLRWSLMGRTIRREGGGEEIAVVAENIN